MVKDLESIGLNEKEAKVYLATLELGNATVQQIATKSEVNRATSYFILENLMKMGLASTVEQDKKQYFTAADPTQLSDLINKERKILEEKEKNLKKILPQIQSIHNTRENKPVVKYYEGKEGIDAMNSEILNKTETKTIQVAYSIDDANNLYTDEEIAEGKQERIEKGIKTEVIYTYKDKVWESTPDGERLKIPEDKFHLKCDIAVYDKFVTLTSLQNRLFGIEIEDEEVAQSMQTLFKLAWESALRYHEEEMKKINQ